MHNSRNLIYLNAGSMTPTPLSVLEAIERHRAEIERNPTYTILSAWEKLWPVQRKLAEFFHTRPEDLFLRTNVTYALNDFLMAVEIPAGSQILVSDLEYGAITNICRYKADIEGHTLVTMPVRLNGLSKKTFLEDFEKQLTPKVKLAMFSHVTTGSGLIFPIEEMAEICIAKGVILAIDGAHGAGSVPLDLGKTRVDFYGSNLHKWMMGPKGTGFGWVSPRVKPRLKPRFAGWTTYELAPHFAAFGNGDPWACRWMLNSTHNFSDFFAIIETIDYWKNAGPASIFSRQKALRDHTKRSVASATGWKCVSSYADGMEGPMIAFEIPRSLADQGMALMINPIGRGEKRVQVSMTQIQGAWHMRLSPHIYNTESEIAEASQILAAIALV